MNPWPVILASAACSLSAIVLALLALGLHSSTFAAWSVTLAAVGALCAAAAYRMIRAAR